MDHFTQQTISLNEPPSIVKLYISEKLLERCKGSVELLNSQARRVNKTEDLFSM